MGALTVSIKRRIYPDGGKLVIADVTPSASYATGGETYTNQQFELWQGADVIIPATTNGYQLVPDLANKKIKIFQGDNPNAAQAPGVEVPNATNLSAQTFRVTVIGDDLNNI